MSKTFISLIHPLGTDRHRLRDAENETPCALNLGPALRLCRCLLHPCGFWLTTRNTLGGFMDSLPRLFIINFVLLLISNSSPALAQEPNSTPSQQATSNSSSAPTITAAFAADRIRFTALGEVDRLRLEVFSAASDLLFDSGFHPGNIRDWQFKDQQGRPFADGSYLCVVTIKDLSGRLRFKQGQILLQGGHASLQLDEGGSPSAPDHDNSLTAVADRSRQALTVLAHDRQDGQRGSTSG